MPGSAIQGKAEIKKWILERTDIKKIIDVGAGSGTYPNLVGNKSKHWTGIEIFPFYINKFGLTDLYNEILIGDIYDFSVGNIEGGLPEGDLIIFGDVLEHLEKERALKVLQIALEKYSHVIISIPVDGSPSKIHYGNIHELHISKWTFKEIESMADWEVKLESRGIGVFIK